MAVLTCSHGIIKVVPDPAGRVIAFSELMNASLPRILLSTALLPDAWQSTHLSPCSYMHISTWRKCCSALLPVGLFVALQAGLIPRLGSNMNDHPAFFVKLALVIRYVHRFFVFNASFIAFAKPLPAVAAHLKLRFASCLFRSLKLYAGI
jgi:hypothetical protein